MKRRSGRWVRWVVGGSGVVFIALALWQIQIAGRGLFIERSRVNDIPITVIAPAEAVTPAGSASSIGADRPVVLLGHGFAGSGTMLRGFAYTLAHGGYVTVVWDFNGHGMNPTPMGQGELVENPEEIARALKANGWSATDQAAILGHSMGSGVALTYAQLHPATSATVAVSPVRREVTPELPRNLLLMAGAFEGAFVSNAEALLEQAGGAGGDPAAGSARKFVLIPGVEHISIVFASAAHAEALNWLDKTFGEQPGSRVYKDLRMLWYGIGVFGSLLVVASLKPLFYAVGNYEKESVSRWTFSIAGGALGASVALWLLGLAGVGLRDMFGLLVGGYMLVWFGLAGLIAWILSGARPAKPTRNSFLGGILVFLALWLGVGYLGHTVWLNWLLIPRRLLLWPLGGILLTPWFLAWGRVSVSAVFWKRLVSWFSHSAVLLLGFGLTLFLNPELQFLLLILPIFPLVLGLLELAGSGKRQAWSYAIGGAFFISWMLLAVFPLQ